MIFSNKISKFGKGDNISLFMETPEKINIFYFKDGVFKKELLIDNFNLILNQTKSQFSFNEIIQLDNFLITRIDKSIGIISNV